MIFNVDYHITDACNLNCISCNHFCPITESVHKPIEQIKSDLYLLSKFRNHIEQISIMGGEPTLHPRFVEIMDFTRSIFPSNKIILVTNGLTHDKFVEWKDCFEKNDILVSVTKYPYKENYQNTYTHIYNILGDRYINYTANPDEDLTNYMQTSPLTQYPCGEISDSLHCRMRVCSQLKNGKLYLCNILAGYEDFAKYFKDKYSPIPTDDKGYVDLNICTVEDINHLVEQATPILCMYCKECNRWTDFNMETVPWQRSTKHINEWLDTSKPNIQRFYKVAHQ